MVSRSGVTKSAGHRLCREWRYPARPRRSSDRQRRGRSDHRHDQAQGQLHQRTIQALAGRFRRLQDRRRTTQNDGLDGADRRGPPGPEGRLRVGDQRRTIPPRCRPVRVQADARRHGADRLRRVQADEKSSSTAISGCNREAASTIVPEAERSRIQSVQHRMNVSAPFIVRPIATTLLVVAIVLVGLLGYRFLSVAALPTVEFPTIQVVTYLARRSPDVVQIGNLGSARVRISAAFPA